MSRTVCNYLPKLRNNKLEVGAGSGTVCSGSQQVTRTKGPFLDRVTPKSLQNLADQDREAWFPKKTPGYLAILD